MDPVDRIDAAKSAFLGAATQARDSEREGPEFLREEIEPLHASALKYFEAVERAVTESQTTGVAPGELIVLSLTRHSYEALKTYAFYWDALERLSARAGVDLQERYRPSTSGPRVLQAAVKVTEPEWAEEVHRAFQERGLPTSGFEDRKLSRILRSAWSPQTISSEAPTILWLSANPAGTRRLRLDQEVEKVREGLGDRPDVDFQPRAALTVARLLDHLNEHEPTVVHFSGHGDGADGIIIEGDTGPVKLTAEALVKFFASTVQPVRLAVLSACASSEEAEALSHTVPCTIGMAGPVLDEAALIFNQRFYRGLVAHRLNVGKSVEQATVAMGALGYEDDAAKVVVFGEPTLRIWG